MVSIGRVPTIAGSAVAGVRHLLIEEGLWAAVRAELVRADASATSWIDAELSVDPTRTAWVPIEHYLHMMDALRVVVGRDRVIALGRERAHRTAQAGAFAPVVRSWSRSFGDQPVEFLKLTLHAWSQQTKNLGEFEVTETRPGYVRFVLRNASPAIAASLGWQEFLGGYGTGLLDLIQRPGECVIRMDSAGKDLETVYTYTDAAPGPDGA